MKRIQHSLAIGFAHRQPRYFRLISNTLACLPMFARGIAGLGMAISSALSLLPVIRFRSFSMLKQSAAAAFLALTLFGASAALAFEPFFDANPATRHAPDKPTLTDLDLAVLKLCGDWGAEVEARDFERMMLQASNAAALTRIRAALGSRIYGKAGDDAEFVRQLRRVWFEQKGFQHVFCGEPTPSGGLGGLHYAARYWQAQDSGWAGYRKVPSNPAKRPGKCRAKHLQERISPPVYSIGIDFRQPRNGASDMKCLSSYHREMSAEDILIAGTLAFKQANKRVAKNAKQACLFETRPGQAPPHYSTLVIKQRALRSFYPQAEKRPYCRNNKQDISACWCSRL
jgi:hypothetical protein